ncbi:MAG: MBL fold metallo-hydrolase [Pseudobdellovibrio sp.]
MSKEGGSTFKTGIELLFSKKTLNKKPMQKINGFKNNLHTLDKEQPLLIWFGHSSYLIKYNGLAILVDPVFCGFASPFSFAIKSFDGTDIYGVDDFPEIDLLVLTHDQYDQYDHIDYETVQKLKEKTKHTICTLGVGEHLEYWGFLPEQFTELDWWQQKEFSAENKITATPARHFSGRGLDRYKTLWASYVLELGDFRLFIGGDSGYDDQFKKIGQKFKSFDLAILECGQYGINWPYIHMFPEQTAQAAKDLNAKTLFPVHWGKVCFINACLDGSN